MNTRIGGGNAPSFTPIKTKTGNSVNTTSSVKTGKSVTKTSQAQPKSATVKSDTSGSILSPTQDTKELMQTVDGSTTIDGNTPEITEENTGLGDQSGEQLDQLGEDLGVEIPEGDGMDNSEIEAPEGDGGEDNGMEVDGTGEIESGQDDDPLAEMTTELDTLNEEASEFSTLDASERGYDTPMVLVGKHQDLANQQGEVIADIDNVLAEIQGMDPEAQLALAPKVAQLTQNREVLATMQEINTVLGQDAGNDKKIKHDNNTINPEMLGQLKGLETKLQGLHDQLPDDNPLKAKVGKNLNRLKASNLASSNSGYVQMQGQQKLDLHPTANMARFETHIGQVEKKNRTDVDATPEGFVMAKVLEGQYNQTMQSDVKAMGQETDAFFKEGGLSLSPDQITSKKSELMGKIDQKYGKVLNEKALTGIKDMVGTRFDQASATHSGRVDRSKADTAKVEQAQKSVEFNPESSDFMDYLNPLDSGGDNIEIKFEGEAGIGVGWFGVDVAAGVSVSASKGDDEHFYLSFSASGEVGATAGKETKAGGGEVRAAVGVELGATYKFDTAKEASDFLAFQMRESIPKTVLDNVMPNLKSVPDMSHIQPTTKVAGYGKISLSGSISIGKFDLSAKIEGKATFSKTTYPKSAYKIDPSMAKDNIGHDQSLKGSFEIEMGVGDKKVALSGSVNSYNVNNNPIPENNGEYLAVEGGLSFTVTSSDMAALGKGKAVGLMMRVTQAGADLGLTGKALDSFSDGVINRITSATKDKGNGSSKSLSISIGVQAQWEVQEGTGDKELQYFRLGMGASASYEAGFDVGVADGKISASTSKMDYQNMVVGDTDITYIQGLFFAPDNKKSYAAAKEMIAPDVKIEGKTMAQWETEWKSPDFKRN